MNKQEAISHFGSVAKLAKALNYTRQGVYAFPDQLSPALQCLIEKASKGALKIDKEVEETLG